mmetsp:Transcript_107489/g.285982  ORF Transcript_107489/g.285982 Transcript_107489/m.285982 type:complete len:216 (+) Transcript_107489:349-996(+)
MLVCDALQLPQEAVQGLLPIGQLPPSRVVRAEESRGTVHDQERVARLAEDRRCLCEELVLVLRIVGPGIGHVLEDVRVVQAIALCNGDKPLRTEGALCVDVERLALGAAAVDGQLAGDAERVAELRLSAAELAEDLRDLPGLDPTAKQRVERCRARGQLDHVPPHLQHLGGADHAHGHELPRRCDDLLGLGVANARNFRQLPRRHERDGLDAIDA